MNLPINTPIILAIESSCDETAISVVLDGKILSNCIYSQVKHALYGGVIPEQASREHLRHINNLTKQALLKAFPNQDILFTLKNISAIAVTNTPGLIGSLIVGVAYAKSLALALNKPLIAINHLQAHIYSAFIQNKICYPFLCLNVSGANSQIVYVAEELNFKIIGQTIDDAAGEAFDKIGKMLGFPYPAGHLIDKNAKNGNPLAFKFPIPKAIDYDFSFSGLKTSVLYFLKPQPADFIRQNLTDLCASVQYTICQTLMVKFKLAYQQYKVKTICLVGGVSANSYLRNIFTQFSVENSCECLIPDFEYCTDNAAMIGFLANIKYKLRHFTHLTELDPKATCTI